MSFRLVLTGSQKSALVASLITLSALSIINPVPASATAIDDLKTEAAKVTAIFDDVLPLAVGSMVFAFGAAFIKRIAYA
jgi:hypothetical protein